MDNLLERGQSTTDGNRRNIKALINPNLKENWHDMSPDVGLVALAIAYREKYYRPPKMVEVVEDVIVQNTVKKLSRKLDEFEDIQSSKL